MFNKGRNFINPEDIGTEIGSFVVQEDIDFVNHLKEVNEEFAAANVNMISGFSDILSDRSHIEHYKSKLMEGATYEETLLNPVQEQALLESIGEDTVGYLRNKDAVLNQIMENSLNEIISESMASGNVQPFVGLTGPIIVRNWIKTIYKDVVEVVTATKPVINQQFEDAIFIDGDGKRHKMRELVQDPTKAMEAWKSIERNVIDTYINLPLLNYDIIANTPGASREQSDSLDLDVAVGSIKVTIPVGDGTSNEDIEMPVAGLVPSMEWGTFSKIIEVTNKLTVPTKFNVQVAGSLDRNSGLISIQASPEVKAVKLVGKISSENNVKTGSIAWERSSRQVVIPSKPHIATGLTKEMIQNQKALHGIDAVAKTVKGMTDIITHMKDIEIQDFIDKQYEMHKGTEWVIDSTFNCNPPATGTYAATPGQWVQERIVNKLEKVAIKLKDILKVENIAFKVIGHPMNVRLFDQHINWVAGSKSRNEKMAGIKLDYSLGVITREHKYHILSSSRIPVSAGLMIIPMPLDGMHKTFTHYEYAFFIENGYRDPKNTLVPAVMATGMYENDAVFPMQARIAIKNNDLDDFADLL